MTALRGQSIAEHGYCASMGSGSSVGWRRVLLGAVLVVGLTGGVAIGTNLAGEDAVSPTSTLGSTPVAATDPSTSSSTGSSPDAAPGTSQASGDCPGFEPGQPFVESESVSMIDLGQSNGVQVQGAVYPRPDYEGRPWSQWGQGLALADGRFYSAIGDHVGPDGNSYVYEYHPSGTLTIVSDLVSLVDHEPGSWGYGKVHGQMVAGPCREIYFSSYWGTSSDISFEGSYQGDILFRIDPALRTVDPLLVPVEEHGTPSLAGWAEGGLVYGEAVDPIRMNQDVDEGPFYVYDTARDEVVFEGPPSPHIGFRNLIVDDLGRAYYSMGNGELAVYDPATNSISTHPHTMPSPWLRASTAPSPDGRIAAVTDEPFTFFVLHPSGEIQTVGPARGYTASMAMHPDGGSFFYIPEAHGGSWETGTPLVEVDIDTGEETVVVELNPLAEEHLGLTLGGTYNVVFDSSGQTLFIGMNAGGRDEDFGEVVLLVLQLP